jgi:hypothetical protein
LKRAFVHDASVIGRRPHVEAGCWRAGQRPATVAVMSSPAEPLPEAVRLRDPAEVVAAIPHLLGFVPDESVVALSLRETGRIGLSIRLDLGDESCDGEIAGILATRMRQDGADAVIVAVFTAAPDVGADLPRRGLVDAIDDALPVRLRDALLVRDDRWWSYLCADADCCPVEGRPVDTTSTGAAALAAVHAFQGRAVLPDRESVVASLRPVQGIAAVSMGQAIDRAAAAFAGDGPSFVAAARTHTHALLDRYAVPPARLTDDEAATVVVAAHDIELRDEMIGWTAERHDPMHGLLRDLVRRAQPPLDAPVCTVLAWLAYSDGDGLVAATALGRALRSDPCYRLAGMLATALAAQVHPRELRRALRRSAAGWP